MQFTVNDNALTLVLGERVDTKNAAEVEAECMKLYGEHPGCAVVMDAEKLTYISSVGLRILMKLRKAAGELTLLNVSRDVYEILEMTGFSEILTVKKALRTISVEGCEVIGEGGNGVVYRLNEDTIIKVFRAHVRRMDIERELACAKSAFLAGIPTAISYDVVKVNDCLGVIYEMLNAKILANCITEEPDNMRMYMDMFTGLAVKMHHTDVSGMNLPKTTDIWYSRLDNMAKCTTPENVEIVRGILDAFPQGNTMIHGDFHMKNVMLQDGELVLIDMGDVSMGHPIIEVTNCYAAMYQQAVKMPERMMVIMGVSPEVGKACWKAFMDEYFHHPSEQQIQMIEGLGQLMAAVRACLIFSGRPNMENHFNSALAAVIEKADTIKYLLNAAAQMCR